MDISGKLRQVNGRLKASKVGVVVEQAGEKLRLRATLPPKPGAKQTEPSQQRVSLGLPANPDGLRRAEKEARLLGAQLAAREFDWARWGHVAPSGPVWVCGAAIEAFEAHYMAAGGTVDTWVGDYYKPLRKLPPGAVVTAALLQQLVESTTPHSRSRVRACVAAGALAKFVGVEFDPKPYRGNYSPTKVAPRDLPTDVAIVEARNNVQNPGWRWVFGMMATYGLRNHEVFHCDLSCFPRVKVRETTKTGAREVWPCYPEWAEEWGLEYVKLPNIELDRSNQKIGHSVSAYLSPLLDFVPYDLRHAWAIRTLLFGWPVELSARQMGHSVDVHTRTYQRWISSQQIESVYQLLVGREDRPKPP
ncbi:MAG: integrase [Shackletoniella antarctica]|jgi:hypothetical protein|uniref:Integrase n=1 Tax=Shackletoniella antarctica TaxID=268115 RepID=A0A2W4WKI9_9CYAN|nr:MAG: integrase [Shackletoniella antarctica]